MLPLFDRKKKSGFRKLFLEKTHTKKLRRKLETKKSEKATTKNTIKNRKKITPIKKEIKITVKEILFQTAINQIEIKI